MNYLLLDKTRNSKDAKKILEECGIEIKIVNVTKKLPPDMTPPYLLTPEERYVSFGSIKKYAKSIGFNKIK